MLFNAIESVRTYFDESLVPIVQRGKKRSLNWDHVRQHVTRSWITLAIIIHLVAGGSFALATASTSEFISASDFWLAAALGGLTYALAITFVGKCDDV